jgi:tetratricopeptide (TPR) repeat protein
MIMRNIRLWPRLVLAALIAVALPLAAQAPTGKIHGHVNDPTGAPMGNGTISLYPGGMASPSATPKYTLNVDANGDYTGENLAPGGYTLVYRKADTPKDKVVDQIDDVKIVAGQDTEANDDMSRQAYVEKLSPEQKKQLEEIKSKNAGIMKENAQIKNLNADLEQARNDSKDKKYSDAVTLMQHDVSIKPEEPLLWVELGQAQLGLKQYSDAETSLNKAITLETAAKKPNAQVIGSAGNALGEAFADDNKVPESAAAYDAAAKAYPPDAGMYFQNETIVMSRAGQADAIVAAADKAIAADPTKPIPYYLKGQALIGKATMDPKTQKIVAPPGCQEAYQKYLQLAPNGQFANDAKQVLAEMSAAPASKSKKH